MVGVELYFVSFSAVFLLDNQRPEILKSTVGLVMIYVTTPPNAALCVFKSKTPSSHRIMHNILHRPRQNSRTKDASIMTRQQHHSRPENIPKFLLHDSI